MTNKRIKATMSKEKIVGLDGKTPKPTRLQEAQQMNEEMAKELSDDSSQLNQSMLDRIKGSHKEHTAEGYKFAGMSIVLFYVNDQSQTQTRMIVEGGFDDAVVGALEQLKTECILNLLSARKSKFND